MINILRMINREKTLIDQALATEDERLAFYQEFFKKNRCATLKDALAIDQSELAIAIIIHYAPNLSVDEIKNVVYGNSDIFEELDTSAIEEITKLIDHLANNRSLYEKAKKMILTNGDLQFSSIFKKEGQLAIMLRHLIDTMDANPKSFCTLVDYFFNDSKAFIAALATVTTFRDIRKEEEVRYQIINDLSELDSRKIKEKTKDKMVSSMTKDIYNVKKLLEPITAARDEYQSLEQATRTSKKNLSRNKTIYENLETDLYKAIQAGEVRNVESLIKKVPSEEIRLAILKLVYTHNHELYQKLSAEYQQLAANDASHYQVLLAKYGISPETYEVGTVMGNSIEDLEKMLSTLSKLKFTTSQELLRIVQTSNLEIVENIQGLAERGIITSELLKEHQGILNPTSKDYEAFMRNLALINKKKLNPHSFTATEEIFVTPHSRFSASIKTLEDYELLPTIKSGMNLSFLQESNLTEAIDTLLELGYESNLEECIELLNYKDKFDRLKVLKALNIPVTDTASLLDILSTDKFYVSDEEISNYIYNASPYHLPQGIVLVDEPKKKVSDVTKLSAFSNTSRTYSFDGVLISKNKVHRNLSHTASTGNPHDRLMYGVLKDATLTDEEVSKVITCLTPEKTTKVVKEKK